MGTGLGERQVNYASDNSGDGLVGAQADPAIAALSNGDFVVVYENPRNGNNSNIDLLAHFFDANGNAISPPATTTLSNGVVAIDQAIAVTDHPAITATANGGFAVIYTDATDKDIDVRTYSATSGMSPVFTVASPGGNPNIHGLDSAAIATFADGSMLVAFEVIFSATDHDVWDAILNPTGTGFIVPVNSVTSDNAFEGESRVAAFGNTAALVFARDPGTINGGIDIVLNFYNSAGTELAAPTFVFGTSSSDVWSHPDVAALSDGRFVVVAQDDTTGKIVAATVDPRTHTVTPLTEFQNIMNSFANPTNPHVVGVPGDEFIVAFESGGDVFQVLDQPGAFSSNVNGSVASFTTGTQDENAVAANASGAVLFAWQDTGSANPNSTDTDTRIEAQAFVQHLAAYDFDGNETSDIPWLNASTGDVDEWKISNGQWAGSVGLGAHPGNFQFAGVGDFNGDATSDIFWYSQSTGQTDIWELNNGQWKASASPGNHPTGYQVAGVGDLNNDGTSDVLFYNPSTGDVDEWKISNGAWAGSVDLGSHPAGFQISGVGYFDKGDGLAGIFWYDQSTGETDMWVLNNGQWNLSRSPGTHPTGYQIAGIGDFNGDGQSDILFYNPTTGDVDEWQLDLGRWSASVDLGTHPGGSAWQISGTGDYNGDGVSDVLWSNSATGQTDIWELSNGHWAASVSPGTHPTGYQVQFPNVS